MKTVRKIYMNVYSDGTVISDNDFIGYVGESLATQLVFSIPENLIDSSFTYTLNFEDSSGKVNIGVMQCDNLNFLIPGELTDTQTLKVQLVISKSDEIIFKSNSLQMNLQKGVDISETLENRYLGLLEETLRKFYNLSETLGTDDLSQFRGIVSFEKTAVSDKINTYTITYTDNSTSSFNVENGTDYQLTEQDKADISEYIFDNFIGDINNMLENRLNGGSTSGNIS